MSDFSRSPLELLLASRAKGYVGLHVEQGVPLLDRDLNLLQDLVVATVRSLFTRYVGDGVAAGGDGFGIVAAPDGQAGQDFVITAGAGGRPGTCLVGGLEVSIGADVTYTAQPAGPVPALTTPTPAQPDPRVDTVYLDVFLVEVDSTSDPDLDNSTDVGMQTSVRLKPAWVVRVAEGQPVPPAADGHAVCPLATLRRPRGVETIGAEMISDLQQRRLTVSDIEQRLSLMEKVLLLPAFVPAPLAEFAPRSGVVGQTITLNGTNFNVGKPVVLFDAVPGTVVGTPTARQIVVSIPGGLTPTADPARVHITVRNAGGQTVSRDRFAVLASPVFAAPTQQFTPTHGIPGTAVTISGFNLNISPPTVQFGTVNAGVVGTPTSTSLVVEVPTGLVPAGQTSADVAIQVTTTVGTDVSDDLFHAELALPAPVFDAQPFAPKQNQVGQNVTLRGTNFDVGTVTVSFDGMPATIVGAPSATRIACQVPTPPVPIPPTGLSVHVTVRTDGGTVTSTDTFKITP